MLPEHRLTSSDGVDPADLVIADIARIDANDVADAYPDVPILGFTWYSLTDQVDWDTALREKNGRVNPVGLYNLDREINPVGKAYKQLIKDWREVLPTQSVCLIVPVVRPQEYDDLWAQRRRVEAASWRQSRANSMEAGKSQ